MQFSYETWRHGGWYVPEVRYPSGAIGCVSRNFPDKKWRIVCDPRPFAEQPTFANRDAAAQAEYELAAEQRRIHDEIDAMSDLELAWLLANPTPEHRPGWQPFHATWQRSHAADVVADRVALQRLNQGPWPGDEDWNSNLAGAMMRLVRRRVAAETHDALSDQGRTFELVPT